MQRYRHMACAGVLVGTTTPGRVKAGKHGRRSSTRRRPPTARVVEGLQVEPAGSGLEAGAERVMPATFAWREYRAAEDLQRALEARSSRPATC